MASDTRSPHLSSGIPWQTPINAPSPFTPVHSPHHSVNSSVSSRTPIHTLSIREYRKQQYNATEPVETPSGKTLRRKVAAPVLNTAQSKSSGQTVRPHSQSAFRPLHLSQSAQQLHSPHQSTLQQQWHADQLIRSQSAEPRTKGGSVSSVSTTTTTTTTSSGKVGHFKSRKRLPKPPAVTGLRLSPSHPATVSLATPVRRPPITTATDLAVGRLHLDDTQTTRTTSTFSLSRFPKPPRVPDSAFSPPHDGIELAHVNTHSYASAAPVTPPATPATIHYRGASFDLVNPHDSLLLHDIVTPSKDFGSSEYLLVHTSEEPFLDLAEMAPKRALYGDFTAAHAGIMRRAEDAFSSSNLDLPLPPTPAAVSIGSSTYTSPIYSPESDLAPPPLTVAKLQNESRFSLKQLTRTLTKRLSKPSEKQQHGQELQEIYAPHTSHVSKSIERDFPRPLQNTYVTVPQSAYFPLGPTSPMTPTSPISPHDESFKQEPYAEVEIPRKYPIQRYDSEPLTSLIPERDESTQGRRTDDPRISVSDGNLLSRPYYDDLESIYASSSIYTSDDRRRSDYKQDPRGKRQSNPFIRYSNMDASILADDYNRETQYGNYDRSSVKSKPLTQDMYRRMAIQERADTISKIIDHYHPTTTANNTLSMQSKANMVNDDLTSAEPCMLDGPTISDQQQEPRLSSTFGEFRSGLHDARIVPGRSDGLDNPKQPTLKRKPAIARDVGLPPREPAPLAPPFQYGDALHRVPHPESSVMFSNQSLNSYGDTRNLLEIPPTDSSGLAVSNKFLPTSSSYSQPGVMQLDPSSSYSQVAVFTGPPTPQEALDQAEEIFQNAANKQKHPEKGIPAIWAGRSSGSLLVAKQNTSEQLENRKSLNSNAAGLGIPGDGNEADWESVADHSQRVRDSYGSAADYESLADYSSSEGTRNSLGINPDGSLPFWTGQHHSHGLSIYSHPSPIRAHRNPFSSSPPLLEPPGRMHTVLEFPGPSLGSSPPDTMSVPAFRFSTHPKNLSSQPVEHQPNTHAPWADRYAFSDKETLELLASGPNDKIMVEADHDGIYQDDYDTRHLEDRGVVAMTSSPVSNFDGPRALERENTFDKLCVIGPRGNLTGTPQGTGMHETGSSVANTSSPGQKLTPSAPRKYPGFYASPFLATGSITTIQQSPLSTLSKYEQPSSQMTLYPRSAESTPVIETLPDPGTKRRQSILSSTTFQRSQRRVSRPNVQGQTKLRQMVLAPDAARKTLSSVDTNFSRYMNGSGRPSTSDTNTPLHSGPRLSVGTLPTFRPLVAHQHSPHLLTVEKDIGREEENRRRKLSWAIFTIFCLLPPCMFLYRIYGDRIMVSLTKGDLGNCTSKSKRVALIAGIAVNVGLITAIVVPIVVLHALGAA